MNISFDDYMKKLVSCYKGKAIGGTLGMPFEGYTNTNSIEFYKALPDKMHGNDDLDLQVVWLETLLQNGFPINGYHLSAAWRHLNFGPDEYGVALHNFKNKIFAPLSGVYGNKFGSGMGGAIRSEIWAALAPGDPALAVSFAKIDASADHYGSGISGSVFLTAVESAAYTEDDTERLIETGLSFVNKDIRFSSAIRDTVKWWHDTGDLFTVRKKILENYGADNWSDVTINVSFIVLAWLAGGGDFGKTVCSAVNCGYDADCTAASVGSILGILNPDGIEKKWSDPIGDKLVLSRQILGVRTSETMIGLCEKTAAAAVKCGEFYNSYARLTGVPQHIAEKTAEIPVWTDPSLAEMLFARSQRDSLLSILPLGIILTYPEVPSLAMGEEKEFSARILNPSRASARTHLKLSVPECFELSGDEFSFELPPLSEHEIHFKIKSNTDYKSAFDFLHFLFDINGMRYEAEAGIISAYPWTEKDSCDDISSLESARYSPAESFIKPISHGAKELAIEVRPAMPMTAAITCQGTRPLKLWFNGEKILEYNAEVYVPGLHRGQSVLANLKPCWNRIVLQAEDGNDGEIFFAIGNPVDWIWLNTLEWRKPREEQN